MKKYTLFIILMLMGLFVSSQIKYETGYFIKENEEKVENLNRTTTSFDFKKINNSVFATKNISLSLRPRYNYIFLNVIGLHKIFQDMNFSFGVEFEVNLSLKSKKWSLIFEPTYEYFNDADSVIYYNGDVLVTVNYKAISFPLGLKYFINLNSNSKVYINSSLMVSKSFNFSIDNGINVNNSLNLSTISYGYVFGVGYTYNNKIGIEFRGDIGRNLTGWQGYKCIYNPISIIFGYTI